MNQRRQVLSLILISFLSCFLISCGGSPLAIKQEDIPVGPASDVTIEESTDPLPPATINNCGGTQPKEMNYEVGITQKSGKEWYIGGKLYADAGLENGIHLAAQENNVKIEGESGLAGRIGFEINSSFNQWEAATTELKVATNLAVGPDENKEYALEKKTFTLSSSVPVTITAGGVVVTRTVRATIKISQIQDTGFKDIGCWEQRKENYKDWFVEDFRTPNPDWIQSDFLKISGGAYYYRLPEAGLGGYARIPVLVGSKNQSIDVVFSIPNESQGDYGIRFCNEKYEFSLSTKGEYALFQTAPESGRVRIVPWTKYAVVGEANNITVMTYNGDAAFFINNTRILTKQLICFKGQVSLTANAYKPDYQVIFSQVRVQTAPDNP